MRLFSHFPARGARREARGSSAHRPPPTAYRLDSGFTMIEIALCLAIIGFALISILLVLPLGMNTQRDTREETIIGQDAGVLLDAIRSGSRGMDDLTNYVYAIANSWTEYNADGSINRVGLTTNSYNWASINVPPNSLGSDIFSMHLTNGLRIIGLLSTPEFISRANGQPISSTLNTAYTSNHIVAYIRSFSGLMAEKPPQDNPIMREDTFSYRLFCVNAPISFYVPPLWQAQSYNTGDSVTYFINGQQTYWTTAPLPQSPPQSTDVPGGSARWMRLLYPQQLANSQRELRLTFLWPQLPNGNVGNFKQTFRASVGGQLVATNYNALFPNINTLYFYQSQSFTSVP